MLMQGIVSRFYKKAMSDAPGQLRLTGQGSMAVAAVEPEAYERARAGRRFWGGNQIIANGIAPVAAIPTTTATLALYNGEPDNGADLAIERINFWLGSGTAAAGATLFVCVSDGPIATTPTMATGYEVASCSRGGRKSKAVFGTAVTIPADPSWVGALSTFQLAAANVGQGDGVAFLDGGIIVPPRHALGIAILSGAGTTPLYGVSAIWSEIEGDRE